MTKGMRFARGEEPKSIKVYYCADCQYSVPGRDARGDTIRICDNPKSRCHTARAYESMPATQCSVFKVKA